MQVSSGIGKIKKSVLSLYPIFLLMLFLWLFEITKPFFQNSFSVLPESLTNLLVESVFLKITGVLVIAVALVLLMLSLLHFKNSLRFGLDEKNCGELINTGVFTFSRNPFFLSLDVYFLGIAILLPNLFFISFAVLTFAGIHFFILKEEKFMRSVYGDEYLEYQRKVRRYLGKY